MWFLHSPIGKRQMSELKISYNVLNMPTEEQTKCSGFSNVGKTQVCLGVKIQCSCHGEWAEPIIKVKLVFVYCDLFIHSNHVHFSIWELGQVVLVPVRFSLALLHFITAGWPFTFFFFFFFTFFGSICFFFENFCCS